MKKELWIQFIRENVAKLVMLVEKYHPTNLADIAKPNPSLVGPITAKMAEQSCAAIRESIARVKTTDPVERFQDALNVEDIGELCSVLQETWFGVPETSSCWKIPGFREAVRLLESPPCPEDDCEE